MLGEVHLLHVGNLVILHRSQNLKSRPVKSKLDDRWFGPYRIHEFLPIRHSTSWKSWMERTYQQHQKSRQILGTCMGGGWLYLYPDHLKLAKSRWDMSLMYHELEAFV